MKRKRKNRNIATSELKPVERTLGNPRIAGQPPRITRSGDTRGYTLAATVGVRRAHALRFLRACGFIARFREYASSPGAVHVEHVTSELELGSGGTTLLLACEHCGATQRIGLPKPARLMLSPAGVPPGLGDAIWECKMAFYHQHVSCPSPADAAEGVGSEAVTSADDAPLSSESLGVATYVGQVLGFEDGRLYRLSSPLLHRGISTNHVVVSAAVVEAGPETLVLAATADGGILEYWEAPGSFRGALDHARALRGCGYLIARAAAEG